MNIYDNNLIVKSVDGLNSISTLKKWRRKAEILCDKTFNKQLIRTGRKSTQYVYFFTKEDLAAFQDVANNKKKIGLDNAIISAFSKNKAPPISIDTRISNLVIRINGAFGKFDTRIKSLEKENTQLKNEIHSLIERISYLESKSIGLKKYFKKWRTINSVNFGRLP